MPVMGAMAENATLFVTYNQLQQVLARLFPYDPKTTATPISHLCAAGAGAGLAVSFVLTPIELVKCRMQVQMLSPMFAQQGRRPPGPVSIASQILRENGARGLWLGQTGTLLREVGGSVAWFVTFELACRQFVKLRKSPTASKSDLGPLELMPSGAAAGVGYTVVLFPADTIKSTIQTARELSPAAAPKSFLQTGLDIYRSKGLRGLYQGCATTCVRSSGSSALIFSIYALLEKVRSNLSRYESLIVQPGVRVELQPGGARRSMPSRLPLGGRLDKRMCVPYDERPRVVCIALTCIFASLMIREDSCVG
jgi:ornithine carrier protein